MASRTPSLLALSLATALSACGGPELAAPARQAPRAPPADPTRWVALLARDTAEIRGLAFRAPVPVRVEAPEAITAHLRAELEDDRGELDLERRIGVALGELPAGVDLVAALSQFVGAEAQGYYSPEERVLVLTRTEADALGTAGPHGLDARATVVHELTHALQHQHFAGRVDSTNLPPPLSDGARARLALLEGDATLVAMEWEARRRGRHLLGSAEMPARLTRWAEAAQVLTEVDVPSYVIESAELPYEAGAVAVGTLYRLGGWDRVNAALADDGLRAAQVLHPERAAVPFVEVPAPEGAALVAHGLRRTAVRTLGEIEVRLYVGRVTRSERAARLAETWRGDALALFEGPSGLAAVWDVACSDAAGAQALSDALAPLRERWRREGCPGVAGGSATRCPATVEVRGDHLVVSRGE